MIGEIFAQKVAKEKMSYSAEISRGNPTCFVFLLDQSASMSDLFEGERAERKADFVSNVVNRIIHDLVIRCTKTEEIRNYYYVSIVGYGDSVGTLFTGSLAGRTLVSVADLGEFPARLENRTKKISDGAGGLLDATVRFPIWIDPVASGGTPMCEAFSLVGTILDNWISEHRVGFPPTVLHLTDGESTDGDPTSFANEILSRSTSDGDVLLLNCHLSSLHRMKVEFPTDDSLLPDDFARTLFTVSSVLPEPFRRAASDIGIFLRQGARGFVFNGDPVSVVQFFEIGTRPANLR
jgi:hypothetical protein